MAENSTRLYAIWARKAPVGVIFRRGPSKRVQLVKWNLTNNQLYSGQWFKGRVYERRCDLSSNGDYLIYFAANHKPPYGTWTAISHPPFFTALALWPKGDVWGGGGLFDADDKGITLNHRPTEMELGENFKLPANFRVRPHGERSGWGEDDPIMSHRLIRDGWIKLQKGKWLENSTQSRVWIEYIEPEVWEKKSVSSKVSIQILLHGINEQLGPWYVQELKYIVEGKENTIGRCDWADINEAGTIYYSNKGILYKKTLNRSSEIVADLSSNTFEEVPPSSGTKKW
ncbi:hypothetical protein [Zooshikella ganghwensis]|uniref:hypothetical protein n=1 Tax=Zooshikella ganghwensis TaxID=202772 RepID=UPI000409EABB|nr:hypothetical protein [Zooshikella ganghwensis]